MREEKESKNNYILLQLNKMKAPKKKELLEYVSLIMTIIAARCDYEGCRYRKGVCIYCYRSNKSSDKSLINLKDKNERLHKSNN